MSETQPPVPDNTVEVPEHLIKKITQELNQERTNWPKIHGWLVAANLSSATGHALVVPANMPGKAAPLAALPRWVHLDAPGTQVRVTKA